MANGQGYTPVLVWRIGSVMYKTINMEMLKCICGKETAMCMAIDCWAVIDGVYYCLDCQKKHKVGWYELK